MTRQPAEKCAASFYIFARAGVTQRYIIVRGLRYAETMLEAKICYMFHNDYEEKYASSNYRIKVQTLTPHVELSTEWQTAKDNIGAGLLYAHQTPTEGDGYRIEWEMHLERWGSVTAFVAF